MKQTGKRGHQPSGPIRSLPPDRTQLKLFCVLGLSYLAVQVAAQAGLRALALTAMVISGVCFLAAVALGSRRFRVGTVLVAGIIPLGLWVAVWGSYSFPRDVLGGALALALAWPLTRAITIWRHPEAGDPWKSKSGAEVGGDPRAAGAEGVADRPRRRFLRRYVLVGFVLIWVVNSGLDLAFESGAETRLHAPLADARGPGAPWPKARVGVALSGGGYRAAIMHAGVLAELDAMQIPVTALSTVSGGSIIGAFYAAGGAPDDFRRAIADGRMNLKRDMADVHNALRLPFPLEIPYLEVSLFPWFAFGRVDVQANLVDRVLLGGTRMADLQPADRPRLQICATDLRSGAGVGLAADGVQLRSPPYPAEERAGGRIPYAFDSVFRPGMDGQTRVARMVAASGAFPGAFNAVKLRLPASESGAGLESESEPDSAEAPERRLLLADGGIVDNWGVGLMLDRYRGAPPGDPWRVDVMLVSAGGRVFQDDEDVPGPNQVRRAVDIIYETAGWHPIESASPTERPPMLLLQPADADSSSPEFEAFAAATTLTDTFSDETSQHLFDLGRLLVRQAAPELLETLQAVERGSVATDR
ncbi:MAG: patatin-like phospholipase family protein [Myxococcota bacterium]